MATNTHQQEDPAAGRVSKQPLSTPKTHVFYYAWYGSPEVDGSWMHWNHQVLPHWQPQINSQYSTTIGKQYTPPDDIGSSFYPSLGPYSCRDAQTLRQHMRWMNGMVVVLSWNGRGSRDDQLLGDILDAALAEGAEIAIHLEPYAGRTATSVLDDLKHISSKYGSHPALHKCCKRTLLPSHPVVDGQQQCQEEDKVPLVYIYDSYHIKPEDWARVFKSQGVVRGTSWDFMVLGLVLNMNDLEVVDRCGFDGGYNYFAADGFTEASTHSNWKRLVQDAKSRHLKLSLSVGPGYIDTRVRPWNGQNTHSRSMGQYYKNGLEAVMVATPDWVSITSFNEWHEGTQIEPAVENKEISHSLMPQPPSWPDSHRRLGDRFKYMDYEGLGPNYYLTQTQQFAIQFQKQ